MQLKFWIVQTSWPNDPGRASFILLAVKSNAPHLFCSLPTKTSDPGLLHYVCKVLGLRRIHAAHCACIRRSLWPPAHQLLHMQGMLAEGRCSIWRALQLCGLTFKEGVASSVLPVAPMDAMLIPDPYTLQVVHRPHERRSREPLVSFSVLTLIPSQVRLTCLHPTRNSTSIHAIAISRK